MERIGGKREEKIDFMSHYKFAIAFENTIWPGYLTEKIFDVLQARTVPIYWGDPEVTRWVNPKAFINVADFPDADAAIDYILEVDRNPELYASYQNAEPFLPDSLFHQDTKENLARFYKSIFDETSGAPPRRSLFTRLYRILYIFLLYVNARVSYKKTGLMVPIEQDIPMRRLLSDHRILFNIVPVLFIRTFKKCLSLRSRRRLKRIVRHT